MIISTEKLQARCAKRFENHDAGALTGACALLCDSVPSLNRQARIVTLAAILTSLLAAAEQTGCERPDVWRMLRAAPSKVDALQSLRYYCSVQANANAVGCAFGALFELLRFEKIWFGALKLEAWRQLERAVVS